MMGTSYKEDMIRKLQEENDNAHIIWSCIKWWVVLFLEFEIRIVGDWTLDQLVA